MAKHRVPDGHRITSSMLPPLPPIGRGSAAGPWAVVVVVILLVSGWAPEQVAAVLAALSSVVFAASWAPARS
jgi:hypothetical protein